MNILNSSTLKEQIFHELNQLELFSRYMEIPESEIAACLNSKTRKTSNPKRIDRHPSVGFKWSIDKSTCEYKIKMHDFADSYWRGDLIDIAGKVLNLNSSNNIDFVKICEHIILNSDNEHPVEQAKFEIQPTGGIILTNFGLELREFLVSDLRDWKKSGLDKEDLEKGKVYAVNQYWTIPKNVVYYNYTTYDVCYAYLLDKINDILIWKFYFVNRGKNGDKRARFITNNIYPLEAMHELIPATALVITKSRADCLVIRKLIGGSVNYISLLSKGELTITVTNLTTETARLTRPLVNELRKSYTYIFFNTDFDPEGIRSAKYHLKHYGIQPLFLTNGKGGTKDYKAKDTKEYVRKFGMAKGVNLVTTIINKLLLDIEKVDNMKL